MKQLASSKIFFLCQERTLNFVLMSMGKVYFIPRQKSGIHSGLTPVTLPSFILTCSMNKKKICSCISFKFSTDVYLGRRELLFKVTLFSKIYKKNVYNTLTIEIDFLSLKP